jgi:hypothetical protein
MTDLSPAAQAVLDGFRAVPSLMDGPSIAAALRAAADQVVPETNGPRSVLDYELGDWDARDDVRYALFAIAAELEGAND